MGNKLELDTLITYSTLQDQKIELTLRDLKGYQNFPKLPKEKDIQTMFKNWLKNVKLDKKLVPALKELPLKYKFRLVYKHEQKLKEIIEKEKIKQKIEEDVNKTIENGFQQPLSYYNIQS